MESEAIDGASPITTLLVSTSYPSDDEDWRGLFIRHMVDALARHADIRLKLWAPSGPAPGCVDRVATPSQSRWLDQLMAAGGIAHLVRRGGLSAWLSPLRLLRELSETYRRITGISVYHINWLQNALPLPGNAVPLLVTVLGTDMQMLRLPGMQHLLRCSFKQRRVVICPNAQWMVPELTDRFGDLASVRFIPFGIDPSWFSLSRRPSPVPKWLCVSRLTRAKIGTLFEWGESHFSGRRRELHLLGPMQEDMQLPSWVRYHGATSAGSLFSNWFPSAHGLITLSQHSEGWPQVMLEALASGLPVIASRIPAHEDLVDSSNGGMLCRDPEELGMALSNLESQEKNISIGEAGRKWARETVGTWDDCADRYIATYRRLLGIDPGAFR